MKRALITGSFDPITLGHCDIITRSAKLFDELIVCGFTNENKSYLFTPMQRLKMIEIVCAKYSEKDGFCRIVADLDGGMVYDYAKRNNIDVIIRGARNSTDFEYECSMSSINKRLIPGVDTIILPTSAEFSAISSSAVRILLSQNAPVTGLVEPEVEEYIASIANV